MNIPFIPAANFTRAHRERVDQIVIHTMETGCVSGAAMAVALRLQDKAKKKSAHYLVDPSAIVQCVYETDVAWHCPKANRRGIGIEHAGRAFSSPDGKKLATDWDTPEGEAVLRLSAALVAGICKRWDIPAKRLTLEEIIDGRKGIIGHDDATEAYATPGGHRDPGPHWPWDKYMAMVAREMEALA